MQNEITSLSLSDSQKMLLAKIQAAPTPLAGGDEVKNGPKAMETAKILIDLGLIEYNDNQAQVADKASEIMVQNNITDESGELSQYGQQLVSMQWDGSTPSTQPPPEPQQQAQPAEGGDDEFSDLDASFESFDLLSVINFNANR
jgi:hypothetical protein